MNRQIRVGDSKNVIVFDPLLTGHVIRRMRSGSVRIFNGNQWETLSLITQERIGVEASKLVEIIDVGSTRVVYFLGQLVKQTGSRNMADIQNIKCNNQRKTTPNRRNFALYQEIGVGESNGGV